MLILDECDETLRHKVIDITDIHGKTKTKKKNNLVFVFVYVYWNEKNHEIIAPLTRKKTQEI